MKLIQIIGFTIGLALLTSCASLEPQKGQSTTVAEPVQQLASNTNNGMATQQQEDRMRTVIKAYTIGVTTRHQFEADAKTNGCQIMEVKSKLMHDSSGGIAKVVEGYDVWGTSRDAFCYLEFENDDLKGDKAKDWVDGKVALKSVLFSR